MDEINDRFCRKFIDDLFRKYDLDGDNVLDSREIKLWMQKEIKDKPLRRRVAEREFKILTSKVDSNFDGKIDKWELYDYCMRNYEEV